MRPSIAVPLLGITLAGLSLPILGPFYVLPAVVPVLAPVLPRPQHVPKDAEGAYDWKASGMHWSWRRALPHGSAVWSATNSYAQVSLSLGASAISYITFEDNLVFDTGSAIEGRLSPSIGGEPCAFSVPGPQIARFRQLVSEAQVEADTAGEAAVLRRIADRLAAADGGALTSYVNGQGCSDLRPEDYKKPQTRFDPLIDAR